MTNDPQALHHKLSASLAGKAVMVTGAAGCIGASVVKLLHSVGAIPVVYDLSERRDRLELIMPEADQITWELGDISDYQRVCEVVDKYSIHEVIHLAALQVPFCKADPVTSANVNVVGTTVIFEAARQKGIRHISYASSIASPAMGDNEWLATLYGAHKVCGEQMAKVYWQDWSVASVGIRPAIIYGPGRDQGMSAAPTIAALAAFSDQAFTVPFSGPMSLVYVDDAAQRFVAAVAQEIEGALVFDMNGTQEDTAHFLQQVRAIAPAAELDLHGEAMPFPAVADDGGLDALLGFCGYRSLSQGIADTFSTFEQARQRGVLTPELAADLIGKNS